MWSNFLYLPLSTCTEPQYWQVMTWYTNKCLMLYQASKAHPRTSACTQCSEKCMCFTFGAKVRCFMLYLTSCPLPWGNCVSCDQFHHTSSTFHESAKPFTISSSSSQFHGGIPTITTLSTMVFSMILGHNGTWCSERCQDPENYIALLALPARVMA